MGRAWTVSVAWRAALLMAVSLAVVAIVLGVALPRSFFEDYGWVAGPAAWAAVRAADRGRAAAAARCPCSAAPRSPGCRACSACCSTRTGSARRSASCCFALWCGRLAATGPRTAATALMDLGLARTRRARHRRLEGHRARDRGGARRRGRARRRRVARRGADPRGGRPDRRAPGVVFDSDDLDAVPGVIERRRGRARPDRRLRREHRRPARPAPDPLGFTREQWEAAHRTLVLSPMAFLERLLPAMRDARLGPRRRASARWRCASRSPRLQLSNAHRPGLVAAFKVLARQVAADGVTLNTVLPGPDRHRPDLRARTARARRPRPRRATRCPPGGSARSRSSRRRRSSSAPAPASYITGTTLLVDGGLTASV